MILKEWLNQVRAHLRGSEELVEHGEKTTEGDKKAVELESEENLAGTQDEVEDEEVEDNVKEKENPTKLLDRPSEYLQRRCPMCFGGEWKEQKNG